MEILISRVEYDEGRWGAVKGGVLEWDGMIVEIYWLCMFAVNGVTLSEPELDTVKSDCRPTSISGMFVSHC